MLQLFQKSDKDPRHLGDWRPLTLLNTFYKLISSVLAERLKQILERIIGHEQKAYIPGSFIGEVSKTTYDMFTFAKKNYFCQFTFCLLVLFSLKGLHIGVEKDEIELGL